MPPAIEVSGLAKRYVIEHESRHDNLRDTLHHAARKLWRRARWGTGFEREEFWALRDVSFSVEPGEVVGIIGRNGAGKSTLLKILSRITEPTAGRVTLRGRVASLLEVGTGFHPDLTGRDNIFLNGAILGMTRAEIRRKFDEIVAFAEVEKFIDTPVKRYSSGMYVRLAFAVAAHLEPEILIIDEVLAVGDAAFQKKCLGKINSVATQEGRAVIFVSHNMQTVRQLCTRALFLSNGSVAFDGPAAKAAEHYFGSSSIPLATLRPYGAAQPEGSAMISEVAYRNETGAPATVFDRSEMLHAYITVQLSQPIKDPGIAIAVVHADGTAVFSETMDAAGFRGALPAGRYVLGFDLAARYLKCETYSLTIYLFDGNRMLDQVHGLPLPSIEDKHADPHLEAKRWGVVRIPIEWKISENTPQP